MMCRRLTNQTVAIHTPLAVRSIEENPYIQRFIRPKSSKRNPCQNVRKCSPAYASGFQTFILAYHYHKQNIYAYYCVCRY
jgi:hypothetical protein